MSDEVKSKIEELPDVTVTVHSDLETQDPRNYGDIAARVPQLVCSLVGLNYREVELMTIVFSSDEDDGEFTVRYRNKKTDI